MANEKVMQLIREAYEGNLTALNLSMNQLTQLPPEIKELKNLTTLDLSVNSLTKLPPEITGLKNLTALNLSWNRLTHLPSEIKELKNLKTLYLNYNPLIQLPPEIKELKNLIILGLVENRITQVPPEIKELKNLIILGLVDYQLTQWPPEIKELKNITELDLSYNQLNQLSSETKKQIIELKNLTNLRLSENQLMKLPLEITELKNLTILDLSWNQLTKLPSEIGKLKDLTILGLADNQLIQLPPEIGELKNLTVLYLSGNQLSQLPPEIKELKNLTVLYLSGNQLTHWPLEIEELKSLTVLSFYRNQLTNLPPEIKKLKNLTVLDLSNNQLTQLPSEIKELKNLKILNLAGNPLTSPPPEIAAMGLEAIFTYLKQTKTIEHNEAKLILVGSGGVGKTCLANRLITGKFLEERITEGINISEWITSAPDSENSKIKLNIWDFGGQEIYHATHQFFLTKRSVYILVWNARKTKDYDNIYYWLHTLEAFGEDSPIILVMSKMSESDDDLNLKDLKSKFPQISSYVKIDSKDGKGINSLKEIICETAWNLPLMRAKWVDSWYEVRKKLKGIEENRISYNKFCEICKSEGLDAENIVILDGYLHDLGIILHFKDRIGLKNIVILKPEWATGAFYKILSSKSVHHSEGVLSHNELDQIWDKKIYPSAVHPQLMELMNKFELAYELPDKNRYLIPELLPKNEPDYDWDNEGNLYFYYSYDSFLPSSIITRFIVRVHQDIEKKKNGMPFCWREGAVLKLQNSRALVKMKPDEKQIEIKIKGDNKRGALGAICNQLDHINVSIKKIKVSKEIPCNCSENCPQRYPYEGLLKAETKKSGNTLCFSSGKSVSVSSLLCGYKPVQDMSTEYSESVGKVPIVFIKNRVKAHSKANSIAKAEQKIDVNVDINIKVDLPQIQIDFDRLRKEIGYLNLELGSDLDKIQDSLDEVSPSSDQDKLAKPLNKLYRFLNKLNDPNSDYNKVIVGTEKGIELAQKVGRTYNKLAQWLAMPQVPDLFLGK